MPYIGDPTQLFHLFERAQKSIPDPQLRFRIGSAKYGVMPSRSAKEKLAVIKKQPSKFLGYIDRSGKFDEKKHNVELNAFLCDLFYNPKQTSAKVGQQTGICMFCARGLTDDRSVEVGYGPQCAETWGLPWGDKDNSEEPEEKFEGDLEEYF